MINIPLLWPPTVNTYYSVYKGRKLISRKGREYKQNAFAEPWMKDPIEGRLSVTIDAFPPDRRKRDIDNIIKPILDVITENGVWVDDEQIDELTVRRRPKKDWSGVRVYITEIEEH